MKCSLSFRNLNDVCFGCDGGCSDATCSSKRSSRVSADVESNTCDTCDITSPSTAMESSCEQPRLLPPKREERRGREGEELRMDDSTNMNHTSIQELDENKDSENGNSMSDSPVRPFLFAKCSVS